jgi:predicted membrane protein
MGKSEIFISTSKDGTYHVSGAMGEIVIRVPKGAAVSVSVRNAIGVVSCPDNYSRKNGIYTSGTYSENQPAIKVTVELPIGAIRIVEYSASL